MAETKEAYVLPLSNDGSPDIPGAYINLPPPTSPAYLLRFTIDGHNPICRQGSLWVNIPLSGEPFENAKFREYQLKPEFNRQLKIDVPITCAGAFAFYVTYTPLPDLSDSVPAAETPKRTPTYYLDIGPAITLRGERIPLESLSIFSVVSKFMGEYRTEWEKHLRGIGERGYNAVHFTPLMTRGASNSPYSLSDQLQFDNACFPNAEKDVVEMVSRMEQDHGLLALTDVVWNHTAHNSEWLEQHPEAGYSIETAPWLESALELDNALLKYGNNLGQLGLPTEFKTEDDLLAVMTHMKAHVVEEIRLWEFYTVDVERDAAGIMNSWKHGSIEFPKGGFGDVGIGGLSQIREWLPVKKAAFLREKALINGTEMLGRYSRRIDAKVGAALLTALYGRCETNILDPRDIEAKVVEALDAVNLPLFQEFDRETLEIFNQIFNRTKYLRLDDHGPKLGPVTEENPLIETYFTRLPRNKRTEQHNPRSLVLVNNGWVWNADAMKDNAGSDSRAYLRREVIVWGDCVKLRYGESPEDDPFLWDFMARYTRMMAKHFAGFRIDNCHSTPLVVAEYLLGEARKVRPNLMVFAELFTGSEEMDYLFTKRLGLTALIREAMQAWNAAELSRLVHRHGGRPIGSFDIDLLSHRSDSEDGLVVKYIRPSTVPALFMDCTHDNDTPAQKRSARDTLPNAALVSMCSSATGSVMGYDEIYPEHINLVQESRLYASQFSDKGVDELVGAGGIGGIKKFLNQLHTKMAVAGFNETHIHHDGEFITVHRVHPHTRTGYLLISRTAFTDMENEQVLEPIYLSGTQANLLGAWKLEVENGPEIKAQVTSAEAYLTGLPSRVDALSGIRIAEERSKTIIHTPNYFPGGSIALLETWVPHADLSEDLSTYITSHADEAFRDVDLTDLNFALYRCEAEERDSSDGKDGVYDIPNSGPLVYAGLQGWWSILEDIIRRNDLGHPLCDNLRDGKWALDFAVGRMQRAVSQQNYSQLQAPIKWLEDRFNALRRVPSFLIPRYFAIIIKTAYDAACSRAVHLLGDTVERGTRFIQELGLVSVQQLGYVKTSLYPTKQVPCLAAGLPHFATDWARCWGRDVFISLRGLLLTTGRFQDAKEHILAFASVLKHGMIPNLLSSGKAPRYNSRDSVWFFLQAIQDYIQMAPDGKDFLKESVPRRFLPYDDTWFAFDDPRAYSSTSTIEDIIQEIFQRHASGISFREYNAGPELDMQMKSEGFQVNIHVDWNTGIIFGGNQWNCGTWMDKMGESPKARNQGHPGTPRDGAAVEITGLLYSALRWVSRLQKAGHYSRAGVDIGSGKQITFEDWANKIRTNFERCYYIPRNPGKDRDYKIEASLVNRRGIYKDLYQSGKPYEDYQLRPNFPIAMVVAPDLFNPVHAFHALIVADSVLLGPTGMATLDPSDLNYRPHYNNSEDSTDFATSKGRNYHQGPEWLWPTGYFLRALLKFGLLRSDSSGDREDMVQQVALRLQGCRKAIRQSPWKGLTELTNKHGSFCADSSPTQAWSAACLLDLYYDASELLETNKPC